MGVLWRIELLGGLRVRRDNQDVMTRVRKPKVGALLGYLTYYGDRSHERDTLVELLWPSHDRETGRNNLRGALFQLRSLLEPSGVRQGSVIIASRSSVRLNPAAVTTDVAEFKAAMESAQRATDDVERIASLAQAVELYRGELLRGFHEDWILSERSDLEERFFDAARQFIKHLETQGDVKRALHVARHAVRAAPLREKLRYELISLYAAHGQPAAALRQYRELEQILRKEEDRKPLAATRQLARQISNQWSVTADASVRRDQKAENAPKPIPGSLPLYFTHFFGREEEITQLQDALRLPDTRLVTLTGLGGSGKTRLAVEVAKRLMDELNGAVWFVPLADLSESQRIVDAVFDALCLHRSPDVEPLKQVVTAFSQQPSLLVLDNVEHLLSADFGSGLNGFNHQPSTIDHQPLTIHVVLTLLGRVPTLKLLATSRRRLGLAGEREVPVLPLPLPPACNCLPTGRAPPILVSKTPQSMSRL